MTAYTRFAPIAIVALTLVAHSPFAYGELVTGWVVHNGTSTVTNGGTNSPTFNTGDNITVMAPFTPISLANDNDSITVFTTLTMNGRTGTGVNTLNTQLRIGLFNGPAGAVVANDANNLGFIIEYSNVAAGGLIREQQSAVQTAPFVSPVDIGNGVQDTGADSIQGADPGPVLLELTLKRNAGKLDLIGRISGTDSVSGNPYLSTYNVAGYSSANFPTSGTFTFNRVGIFLGNNVNTTTVDVSGATVFFAVPESRYGMLAVALLMGSVLTGLKLRRAGQRQSQKLP